MALPGEDLVAKGVVDPRAVEALLVSIGAPRLRAPGIELAEPFPDPEERLDTLFAAGDPLAAHGRCNPLVRRLVSYERAAECAIR